VGDLQAETGIVGVEVAHDSEPVRPGRDPSEPIVIALNPPVPSESTGAVVADEQVTFEQWATLGCRSDDRGS